MLKCKHERCEWKAGMESGKYKNVSTQKHLGKLLSREFFMTLKELALGQSATILSVGGEGALKQHFLDMVVLQCAVAWIGAFVCYSIIGLF